MKTWIPAVPVLLVLHALGQVPANDNYDRREPVGGYEILEFANNVLATEESSQGEPRHAGAAAQHSVWWIWTPPDDGYAVLDTTNSSFASRLGIYVGKKLPELEGSSPSRLTLSGRPAGPDHYEFQARKDSKYDLAVDGRDGATGDLELHLKLFTRPKALEPPADLTVTESEPASFTVRAIGTLPLAYQWQHRGDALGSTFTNLAGVNFPGANERDLKILVTSTNDAGRYRVIVSNRVGSVTSAPPAVLTVISAPKITTQPKDLTVDVGDTATFTAAAIGGEPLFYQWQFKGVDLPGENFETLTLVNVSTDEAGLYRMWVTNSAGKDVSASARLTVNIKPPSVLQQPEDLTVILGDDAGFATAGKGYEPIDYQWWFRPRKGGAATVFPGAIAPELYLYSVGLEEDGFYWAVLTNRYGKTNTREATLTVEIRPPNDDFEKRSEVFPFPEWTTLPLDTPTTRTVHGFNKNGTAQLGEPGINGQKPAHSVWWSFTPPTNGVITVDLAASFPPLLGVYSGVAIDRLVPVTNGTTKVTFVGTKETEYCFAVDGADGKFSPNVADTNIALTVSFHSKYGAPVIMTEPADAFDFLGGIDLVPGGGGCRDQSFLVEAFSVDGFVRYQWQFKAGDDLDFNDLAGQTNARLALAKVTLADAGEYRAVAFNLQDQSATSRVATLTVNVRPAMLPGGDPTDMVAEACSTVMNRVLAEACGALSYQWRFWEVPLPGQTNAQLVLPGVSPADAGPYDVIVSNPNGSITSRVAQLTVNVAPVIAKQPADQGIVDDCSDAQFSVTASTRCALAYQWRRNGVPIPANLNATATHATLVWPRPRPSDTGDFDVVARTSYGAVTSQVARLTVNAGPSITSLTLNTKAVTGSPPYPDAVRDCAPVYLEATAGRSCSTLGFQWRRNGVDLPGETNGFLAFTASVEAAADYTVVVTNNWASATSVVARLTVDARPLVTLQPSAQRLLAGGTFTNLLAVSSCSAVTHRWQFRRSPADTFQDIPLDARHRLTTEGWLVVQNAQTNETGYYRAVASNAHTNALSEAALVRILVRPPNDDFVNRLDLGKVEAATVNGFNEMGTAEKGEPDHAYQLAQHSIWYSWTAPFPCLATVDLSASDIDTVLGVYVGNAVTNLFTVTFDDGGGRDHRSKVSFLAGPSQSFRLAVDGKNGAESQNVVMAITTQKIISPPVIYDDGQPNNAAATSGMTVNFDVRAYGSPDLTAQWLSNAVPIPGATTIATYGSTNYASRLTLANIETNFEANYRVVLGNDYGAVTSRIARLTFGSIVKGMVTDATTGLGIPDARVAVGLVATNTDAFGNYELVGVRRGETRAEFDAFKRRVRLNEPVQFTNLSTLTAVQFTATKEGYYDYLDDQFEVGKGQVVAKVLSLSPIFQGLRFILNWGLQPDLDFYLHLPPSIPNLPYNPIFYPEEAHGSVGPPFYAKLDYDTNRFGPETITISRLEPGIYSLYVQKFAPSQGELTQSGAKVLAYFGSEKTNNLYGAFGVPTEGSGLFWHVCDIEGPWTNISWVNKLVDVPPGGLPSSPGLLGASAAATAARRSVRLQGASDAGLAYEWNFGDGQPKTAENYLKDPAHAYADPGWYDITLQLTQTNTPGGKSATRVRQQFILVTNTPPLVALTNPAPNLIFRAGDPITLQSVADGIDDGVKEVEYLLVEGARQTSLGKVQQPPYTYTFPNDRFEDRALTFIARATDIHGESSLSAPLAVQIRDVRGDILIIQSRPDAEIDALTERLQEMEIPDAGGTGPVVDRHPPGVKVLDQEGLRFELVQGFRLIIWDDVGARDSGITPDTVGVLWDAWQHRIPLYFIGETLASSAFHLDALDEPAAVATWTNLVRLVPTTSTVTGGQVSLQAPVGRANELFHSGWYGDVTDFEYPRPIEDARPLCSDTEVRAKLGDAAALMRIPPVGQENPLIAPRLVQNFLVSAGGDEASKEQRVILLHNAVLWLLGNYCENFSATLYAPDGSLPYRPTTCDEFVVRASISNNGRCSAASVMVSNTVPTGLQIRSAAIVSDPADANIGEVIQQGKEVLFGFGELKAGATVTLEVTLRACQPGVYTNLFACVAGHRAVPRLEQTVIVEGPLCIACYPLEVARTADGIEISVVSPPSYPVRLETSDNLPGHWQPVTEPAVADDRGWHWRLPFPQARDRFYQLRLSP